MNVRIVAALLQLERGLDDLERDLRLKNDRRSARKVADIKEALARAMAQELQGLSVELQDFAAEA